jgi:hypothetical protein
MADAESLPKPPDDANRKDLFEWIEKVRDMAGIDYMLSSYYDEGVPLDYIVGAE